MIVQTAQQKFPEYAAVAQAKAQEWAKDPEVQAKAYHYAGVAGQYLGSAGEVTVGLVEQGPTGVRLLAFAAGVLSCVNAFMFCTNVGNLVFSLAVYIVSGYQVVFSVTTMIFEAPPNVIEKVPGITAYQDLLIDKAKFISEVLGRGLFYFFQGTLWLAFADVTKLLNMATGFVMAFVGVLHIAMHFGKLGEVASKMRQGYERTGQGGP